MKKEKLKCCKGYKIGRDYYHSHNCPFVKKYMSEGQDIEDIEICEECYNKAVKELKK